MIRDLGYVEPGTTLYLPFHTFDSNDPSASATLTGLATTDIEVYSNGGITQRASDNGYALLDTDGIDFDAITGIHGISINLADNSTAGFYAAGNQYWVVISSVTVDAATINFVLATFRIGYQAAILNTTIATLASQTSFTLTVGPAEDDALNGSIVLIHDVASAVQKGYGVVLDYTGSTKTVTLLAGTTFTAAATDNISVFPPVNASHAGSVAYTATRGLAGTALPAVAAEAAGGLYTRGTGAGQINQSANGMIDTNPMRLNNVSQSLLDLVDFADAGYDPATNKVQGVVLVDTLTTYTGNTPQTGDVFPLASTEIADIKAKTDNLPSDPADQSLIIVATDAIMARLGVPAGASVSADNAAIKAETAAIVADTNELQTDWVNGGRLDLILDARSSQTSVDDLPTNAELATSQAAADDATLAAIAALNNLDSTAVQTAANAALVALHLDHLIGVADPGGVVANNSFLAKLVSKSATAAFADYDNTTDSLQAAFDNNFSSSNFTRLKGLVPYAGFTIGATGNDATHLHLDGLLDADDELNDHLLVILDVSTGIYYTRWIQDWVLSTELATVATLPFTPQNLTDTYWITSIRRDVTGGSGLDAAATRAALGMASANLDTQLGTIDNNVDAILSDVAAIGVGGAGLTAIPWNAAWNPKVQIAYSGTATGGTQLTLIDAALTQASLEYFRGMRLTMTSGTNANLSRLIFNFNAGTDTLTVSDSFPNAIANGDTYLIHNNAYANVLLWNGLPVGNLQGGRVPAIFNPYDSVGSDFSDSGTTTTLFDAGRAGQGDDFFNGFQILFLSGSLEGFVVLVTDYSDDGTFTFIPALPEAVTTHQFTLLAPGVQNVNLTHWLNTTPEALLTGLESRLLNASATAALQAMFTKIITVDDATFTPTTTVFETDQTTNSSARYLEQVLYGLTGTNAGMTVKITTFAFANSKDKLTVDTLRAAPADGDTFLLIGRIEQ